jgi:hypothetical protein
MSGCRPIRIAFGPIRIAAWILLAATAWAGSSAWGQAERCGAGKDLVVQALERATAQSDSSAFADALQLLKHAVSECGELGDAWYYRSLVEQKLGHDALAKYALDKARLTGSEALEQGLNPFVLATPVGREMSLASTTQRVLMPSTETGKGMATSTTAQRGMSVEPDVTKPPSLPVTMAPGPVQQKWALVVGIGRFSDGGVPRLNYTTADANAFAAQLIDPGIGRFSQSHVHVLTDEQATTKNIKEGLNWIARHAEANDLVLIYVATHGTPRTLDSAGGANYLVTYDTEVTSAGRFDEDAMYATAYPMVELANAVATRMKALRTAVILDTCYSGGSMRNESPQMGEGSSAGLANTAPSGQMLARMSQGTGRIVLAASQVDEESLESDELRHGYFTYFLLQALKDGKGITPLSQIYGSVAQQVTQRVSAQGMRQHPVMSRSSEDADFALGVAATEPAKAAQ